MTEMKKFTKVIRLGHRETVGYLNEGEYIVVYEKLDGANASFRLGEEGEILAFSRNNPLSIENTLRGFYNFTRNIDVELTKPSYIYFGEWLVPHKVDYADNIGHFYLFDIYSVETGEYLSHIEVVTEAMRLGLAIAPIIYAGPYRNYEHLQSFVGRSYFAKGANEGEGIVVKNVNYRDKYGDQLYVKMVSDAFREVVSQKAPRDPNAFIAERHFVEQTVTEARVDKHLRKLIDEGLAPTEPDISDMGAILKALGNRIVIDIIEEESELLPTADYDMQNINRACGKRVPLLLRKIIEG